MMEDVKASDKPKFCHGDDDDDGRDPISHEDVESESEDDDDNDDIPLAQRFPRISSLRTCSSKRDASVEKRDTTILPVKRVFGNNNSLYGLLKKSKVSPTLYHDNGDNTNDDGNSLFFSMKKKLELVENSFDDCRRIRKVEKKRLQSIKRDIEKFSKELENKKEEIRCVERINEAQKKMQGKIEECVKDLVVKEGQLCLMDDLIGERKQELKAKELELRQVMDKLSGQKLFDSQVPELVNDLVLQQNHFEIRMEELQLKEKQLEGKMKEHQSKESKFECQVKELESEKKHFESRLKELESKENQFDGQRKEFQSKEEEFKGQVKQFESNKEEFEGRVKELESQTKKFESQVEDFKLKEKQFEGRWKELESKETKFKVTVKELQLKEEHFEGQVKDPESKLDKFEGQVKDPEPKLDKFDEQLNEPESTKKQCEPLIICLDEEEEFEEQLELKEKQIEGQVKDPESKLDKFDGHLNEPESTKKQCEPVIICLDEEEEFESCTDNELSPTSEQNDEFESADRDILATLQGVSDPSKAVLEMILHPTIPKCKMGDEDDALIIENTHINLLEGLMRISPDIRPQVREEAMKLALIWKAKLEENNENSLVVLGFLLVLAIYGLVPSFGEDYILKLFGLVSQHNIAVELFRAMGFADKISYFVNDLIKRQQCVEAVRFSRAFNFGDNNQLVDLLRGHVQNAKLLSESSCNRTNLIEIKDHARDQEIASLETVILCLLNNSLESKDLLNEIDNRILELRSQRGK